MHSTYPVEFQVIGLVYVLYFKDFTFEGVFRVKGP